MFVNGSIHQNPPKFIGRAADGVSIFTAQARPMMTFSTRGKEPVVGISPPMATTARIPKSARRHMGRI